MLLSTLCASMLALAASANAYKYKTELGDTTKYPPFFLTVTNTGHADLSFRNIQVRPLGNEYTLAVDSKSPVFLGKLENQTLQAFHVTAGRTPKPLNLHGGVRKVKTIDGGNTTISEFFLSNKPVSGQNGWEFVFDDNSRGEYFLIHNVPLPKGFNSATQVFALCERNSGEYYQFSEIVSGGRKIPAAVKGCTYIGAFTYLAPKGQKLKGPEKSFAEGRIIERE